MSKTMRAVSPQGATAEAPPTSTIRGFEWARWLVVGAAALIVIGATAVHWITVSFSGEAPSSISGLSHSIAGTTSDPQLWIIGHIGDGWVPLILGVFAAFVALALARVRPDLRARGRLAILAMAVGIVAWLVASHQNIQAAFDDQHFPSYVHLGFAVGFWMTGAGAIALAVGALRLSSESWWSKPTKVPGEIT